MLWYLIAGFSKQLISKLKFQAGDGQWEQGRSSRKGETARVPGEMTGIGRHLKGNMESSTVERNILEPMKDS